MKPFNVRTMVLGALIAPLALTLAACGADKDAGSAGPSGEPIAKVAPPAGQAWADMVVRTPEGGFRMGNPKAPIALVEFGSLTCPHCAAFAAEGDAPLRDEFVASGRVSVEFRPFILNSLDLAMSMIVTCAAPEAFFALKEQTYAGQTGIVEKWMAAGEAKAQQAAAMPPAQRYGAIAELGGLPEFYSARGISQDQAKACLANAANADALVKNAAEGQKQFNIEGTPTFVLNGSKIEANTWDAVKAALEKAGAR